MPRTLSSNVSTGILGGDVIPIWLIKVIGRRRSDGVLTEFNWSTSDDAGIPEFTSGRIVKDGLDPVTSSCDIASGGGAANIENWKFDLINADNYWQDTLFYYDFENRPVALRLISGNVAGVSWANAARIFTGFVENVYPITPTIITFNCIPNFYALHRDLPKEIIAGISSIELIKGEQGTPKQLVYGDFDYRAVNRDGLGYMYPSAPAYSLFDGMRDLIKHKLISPLELLYADHELHTANLGYETDYGGGLHSFYLFKKESIVSAFIKRGQLLDANQDFFHGEKGYHGQVLSGGGSLDWVDAVPSVDSAYEKISDAENCVNEDNSDFATFSGTGSSTNCLQLRFRKKTGATGFIWWKLYIYATEENAYGELHYQITMGSKSLIEDVISTLGVITEISMTAWNTEGIYPDVLADDVIVKIWSTNASSDVYLYNIKLSVKRADEGSLDSRVDNSTEGFACVKGRKFNAWIDAPNHSNSKNAGDLIRNPADLIESLLIDECHLTPENLSKAIDFNSVSGLFCHHDDVLSLTTQFAFSCWVSVPTDFTTNPLIRKGSQTYAAPYDWLIGPDRKPRIVFGNGVSQSTFTATNPVPLNTWTHIGVSFNSALTATHYLNGAPNGSTSILQARADSLGDFFIGTSGSIYADLRMDELKVWGVAKNDADMLADYNLGTGVFGEPEDDLILLFHFDEGQGLDIRDWAESGLRFGYTPDSPLPTAFTFYPGKVKAPQKIKESSFDVCASARSNWNFAAAIADVKNSRSIIDDICREAGFVYMTRSDGLEGLALIEKTASLGTIMLSDVQMDQNEKELTLSVNRSKMSNVFNEFVLKYRNIDGKYDGVKYVLYPTAGQYSERCSNLSSAGSTYWAKCRACYTSIKAVRRWTFEANFIREDVTAETFLKFMIYRLTRRPWEVKFEATLKRLADEIIDEWKINIPDLPPGIQNVAHFKLTKQTIDPSTCRIAETWLDVGTTGW